MQAPRGRANSDDSVLGAGKTLARAQSELVPSATAAKRFVETHYERWAASQSAARSHTASVASSTNMHNLDATLRSEKPRSSHGKSTHSQSKPSNTVNPLQASKPLYRLTKKEKIYLTRKAKESALALIEHAHTLDGPVQWHYKGKHRGIQMYRGEGLLDESTLGPVEFLCGVTTMMGTLKEVSDYFDQGTTARMRMKKPEDVMDCAVLYSLISGNTVNPFHRVGVKYVAFGGAFGMARNRDFCYLECQDTFRHASGRRGWVLSMHSIKLPSCPEISGFVRGSMYNSGFVFVESERPGYMDVMHTLQLNLRGSNQMPQFLVTMALKRRLRELIHISREIQVARIAHRTLLKERDLMPKHLRTTCGGCARKFWLFVRKTRCRVCGEVFCQSCAPEMIYEGPGSVGPIKTRVCLQCCNAAPTTGAWASHLGNNDAWTEGGLHPGTNRGLALDDFAKSFNIVRTPRKRRGSHGDIYDSSEDEDEDGDGRYTFAELEEASSRSVFAPERFTGSSVTSSMLNRVGDDNEMENDTRWKVRGTEDSLFDSNSLVSTDSYFGRRETAMTTTTARSSQRPNVALIESAEEMTHSSRGHAATDAMLPTSARARHELSSSMLLAHERSFLRESSTRTSDPSRSRSLRHSRSRGSGQHSAPSRPSAQTSANESVSTLGMVALDDIVPPESFDASASLPPRDLPRASSMILRQLQKRKALARSAIMNSNSSSSPRRASNESKRSVEDPQRMRMEDLSNSRVEVNKMNMTKNSMRSSNRTTVSTMQSQSQSQSQSMSRTRLAAEPTDDSSWRSSEAMEQYYARRKNTLEALRKKAMPLADSSRGSSDTERTAASSRSPSFLSQRLTGMGMRSDASTEDTSVSEVEPTKMQYGDMFANSEEEMMAQEYFLGRTTDSSSDTIEQDLLGRLTDGSDVQDSIARKYLSASASVRPQQPTQIPQQQQRRVSWKDQPYDLSLAELNDDDLNDEVPFPSQSDEFDASSLSPRRSSALNEPELVQAMEEELARSRILEQEQERQQQQAQLQQKQAFTMSLGPTPRVSGRSLYREIGTLSHMQSAAASSSRVSEQDRIKDQIREQYKLIRRLQLKP